jgi:hypothetical protein
MSEDKDFLDRLFNLLNKLFSFLKTSFGVYLIFIILIILFPPVDYYDNPRFPVFSGWWFITDVGGIAKINIIYFLGEIGIVTLVYFVYLQSRKK